MSHGENKTTEQTSVKAANRAENHRFQAVKGNLFRNIGENPLDPAQKGVFFRYLRSIPSRSIPSRSIPSRSIPLEPIIGVHPIEVCPIGAHPITLLKQRDPRAYCIRDGPCRPCLLHAGSTLPTVPTTNGIGLPATPPYRRQPEAVVHDGFFSTA